MMCVPMYYLIRDLNQDEKPREKLLKFGPGNLTDVELLAIVLRAGGKGTSALDLARQILAKHAGLAGLLTTDAQKLQQTNHVNIAKSCAIAASIEIGLRTQNINKANPLITKPTDVVKLVKNELVKTDKEHLYLFSLNTRNRLIAKDLISVGTANETMLSPREIFRQALSRNAINIVILHNHPSNDSSPSQEDITATQQLYKLCSEMGIYLLDHIIFSGKDYCSLKQLNLLSSEKSRGGDKK